MLKSVTVLLEYIDGSCRLKLACKSPLQENTRQPGCPETMIVSCLGTTRKKIFLTSRRKKMPGWRSERLWWGTSVAGTGGHLSVMYCSECTLRVPYVWCYSMETCAVPVVRVYFYSLDPLVLNSCGAMVSPAASGNELVTHRNFLFPTVKT